MYVPLNLGSKAKVMMPIHTEKLGFILKKINIGNQKIDSLA